jgi:hypothetical protein
LAPFLEDDLAFPELELIWPDAIYEAFDTWAVGESLLSSYRSWTIATKKAALEYLYTVKIHRYLGT